MDFDALLRFLWDRPYEEDPSETTTQSYLSSTPSSGLAGIIDQDANGHRSTGLIDDFDDQSLANFTSSSVENVLDPSNFLFNLSIFVADHVANTTSNLQHRQVPTATSIPPLIKNPISSRHLSLTGQVFITVFYLLGIGGNVGALVLLTRGETVRNRKQTLMIRCLVWHDLLALVGSFALMYTQLYLAPELVATRWFCALRVLLRTFGLSSGCVAIVMAVERWLALTRPFLYHKHVTLTRIRRAIFTLWLVVLVLVCLPFFGFGLYYNDEFVRNVQQSPSSNSRRLGAGSQSSYGNRIERTPCIRYRFARRPCHVAYAYVLFSFGMFLSIVIAGCNLAVVRALCRMGKDCPARRACATTSGSSRQLSHSGSYHSQQQQKEPNGGSGGGDFNHATNEEISFAKLMIILSVFFVTGWVPQMVTIIMAQASPHKMDHPFYRLADIFLALNFVLDPVVYVLSRRPHRRSFRRRVIKLASRGCFYCCPRSDLRDGSLRSSTQAFLYKTNFISSNYRVHGPNKKLQLGNPGDDELGSERRSSSSGSRVNSGGSGGSLRQCGEHLCCYHVQDRCLSSASNGAAPSCEVNEHDEIVPSPIILGRRKFGRIRAPRINFCTRSTTHEACIVCQGCPTCPRACPGCCHFACGSRRHQRPQPTRYRMKYPPDEGPFPRHLRNCHSEGCGQQLAAGHHCVRKYQNTCINDDRPVVSDFVLETRSSLYFHI